MNSPYSGPSGKTIEEYDEQFSRSRDIYIKKMQDYGTSWRILRVTSLIDQIFIKAQRIRSIEEKGEQKVGDTIESEFIGIVNYCIITLIQLEWGDTLNHLDDSETLTNMYNQKALTARQLMEAKNHDYGEAWRGMYVSSFTDLILSKVLRIRQIIENKGKTLVSEGIDANLYDMINYALFALIKLRHKS